MTKPNTDEAAAKAAAAAQAKADKEAAAAKKKADAAAAKEAKAKAAADAKAAKDKAKADAVAAKDAAKAAKQAEKDKKAADKLAAKEAAKMPEQNGVRRPKPDGKCGRAWAIFDSISQKNGAPASIAEAMEVAKAEGQNEANVRAEYARWRKFHGVTGRIEDPRKPAKTETQAAA